jgi:hypothetical protein
MDYSVTFARHFARLVWLLSHEPASTDEQKAALRALAALSREGTVKLDEREQLLIANDTSVPPAFEGVAEVAALMAGHGVSTITIDAGTSAAHILGVVRILARAPTEAPGDAPGTAAEKRRAALGTTAVRFSSRAEPLTEPAEEPVQEPVPRAERIAEPFAAETPETPGRDAWGDTGAEGMTGHAGGRPKPTKPLPALLAQLDQAGDVRAVTDVLDDLTSIAEDAAREGTVMTVVEILTRIAKRETEIEDAEVKRAVATAWHRLAAPEMMRVVAAQLPHAAAKQDELIAVLAHADDDGAAVVEQLGGLTAQSDGRAYFRALVKLRTGIPALIQLLGDSRWFVARSAVDALGDMQAREAEQALTALMRHEDARLRNGARGALMRLGTPKALVAIQEALRCDDAALRIQAALAMGGRNDAHATRTLVHALNDEKDEEVQAAQLRALGKLGTRDAVQRLLEEAAPEQGLFKKKSSALRVAAVKGLAEAGTASAMVALRKLTLDKDESVREAALYASRRRTGSSKL